MQSQNTLKKSKIRKNEGDAKITLYDKQFKKETVRLSDEIGARKAAKQLGISYNTLIEWRRKRTQHGEKAHIGSGRANDILKDALGFFAKDRKK